MAPFRLAPRVHPLPDEPLLVPYAGRKDRIVRKFGWRHIEGRRIRLVDRDVAARLLNLPKRLPNAGGLPGLTRTEDGDDPAGHPGEPTKQRVDLGALKRIHLMNMRS